MVSSSIARREASKGEREERKHAHFRLADVAVVVVQLLSRVQLFATPWTAARQASLPTTISWSLLKLMSIESVTPSNHLVLCHPLLLPSVFPRIRQMWPMFKLLNNHM